MKKYTIPVVKILEKNIRKERKYVYEISGKLFIKNPIIRINTVFFKEIAIKNRSFYHEFTTFERALI